ncbi:MAG TPA: CaiB/BaiF CoA-transferase family protein [Steroidobacteraceae bacterium]|nr:CaiB/BaiF CoA-transferase family protein [Steroidobacteraceae bacterium]
MGPLAGITVVELAALGPAPFCGMMLADLGAQVIRIERASARQDEPAPDDPLQRNRRSIALDLKNIAAVEVVLTLLERADVLIEGFRPGVLERLGLGPDACFARNPRLIYGRMTGWGQDGPLAPAAGHDINYIALAGVLNLIGPPGGKPVPPLNLVGDFGGGGMLLAFGVLAALLESRQSGRGQVVDAAMVDGAAALLAMFYGLRARGMFHDATGANFLAGAAPYYDTYRTKDHKYVAIGALEPQFFAQLLDKLGLDWQRYARVGFPVVDPGTREWIELRSAIAAAVASRTRDEWCRIMEGTDACFAPVLTLEEAARHPHNVARGTFTKVNDVEQNAPAPRFSRTHAQSPQPPRRAGEDTEAVLTEAGFSRQQIDELRAKGALT